MRASPKSEGSESDTMRVPSKLRTELYKRLSKPKLNLVGVFRVLTLRNL
jgi:hypothetical protein